MSGGKNLVIAIYSHPEYYPPSLNAIEYLSEIFDEIAIVHRSISGFDWKYPANVRLYCRGEVLHVRDAEQKSTAYKVRSFFGFTKEFVRLCRKMQPDTILLYDYMPFLSYYIAQFIIKKPRIFWYHNHDVAESQYLRKWSLSWLAWKSESALFSKLDMFSLPSNERKACFPMEKFKGTYIFLPNYPATIFYKEGKRIDSVLPGNIRLLYQGSIGQLHGLEEIIGILDLTIEGRRLELVLKGFISPEYKSKLKELASNMGVIDQLIFMPPSGYLEVIDNAFTCHIGIGIHKKQDMMNKTLGTASNKIYEYAAAGMPVLIYDNEHFRETLKDREWVFYTDTSKESLIECILTISGRYDYLSRKARLDFENDLCYEHYFSKARDILEKLSS